MAVSTLLNAVRVKQARIDELTAIKDGLAETVEALAQQSGESLARIDELEAENKKWKVWYHA